MHTFLTQISSTLLFTVGLLQLNEVKGHGRLMEPPSRNSQWRLGYPNPQNYQDNELFCGGSNVMWSTNGGKCGTCGDPYHNPLPRAHEIGGKYANGIIVQRYAQGQNIKVEVELTANHYGTFTFHICPYKYPLTSEATEECLKSNPMKVLGPDGQLMENFKIPKDTPDIRSIFQFHLRLPPNLVCSHCVLRWTWVTGNTWGQCPDGTSSTGCGPQETFVNCADVSIESILYYNHGSHFGHPNIIYQLDPEKTNGELEPLILRSQRCLAHSNSTRMTLGLDEWCMTNCLKYPPNCPTDMCYCLKDCRARPGRYRDFGKDKICNEKCLRPYPTDCSDDECICF